MSCFASSRISAIPHAWTECHVYIVLHRKFKLLPVLWPWWTHTSHAGLVCQPQRMSYWLWLPLSLCLQPTYWRLFLAHCCACKNHRQLLWYVYICCLFVNIILLYKVKGKIAINTVIQYKYNVIQILLFNMITPYPHNL